MQVGPEHLTNEKQEFFSQGRCKNKDSWDTQKKIREAGEGSTRRLER